MAYVDQTKKAKIAAELKKVMPKGWKYTLAVRTGSTLTLTIQSAPVDILKAMEASEYRDPRNITYAQVNPYYVDRCFADAKVREVFCKIRDAMNTGNHDRSDVMTDYFDVGHYIAINVGRWDKAFEVK